MIQDKYWKDENISENIMLQRIILILPRKHNADL